MKNISNTDLLAVRVINEGRRMEKERADSLIELLEIISSLHAERDKAKSERDTALEKIAKIMAGFEGCCMACEPVGVRNQQMEREIAMLKDERDEARRIACGALAAYNKMMFDNPMWSYSPAIAEIRGWDCFKEKQNEAMDRPAQLDQENGLL